MTASSRLRNRRSETTTGLWNPAAGWCAQRIFRPNGLVVAHTAVTMWTVLGGAAAAALAAAAVGRSHGGGQRAPFVLVRVPRGGDVRNELRRRGFAVRRGGTFPGLGPDWPGRG